MKPVNPNKIPKLDESKLTQYPAGYRYVETNPFTVVQSLTISRYLSYCQEATMKGVKVMMDLPGHRRENDNLNGKAHDDLYMKCKLWVEGGTINAAEW